MTDPKQDATNAPLTVEEIEGARTGLKDLLQEMANIGETLGEKEQAALVRVSIGPVVDQLCDAALRGLDTRSVIESKEIDADAVLHAHTDICELFAENSGDYDPTPDEVDAIQDGLTLILGKVVEATLAAGGRSATLTICPYCDFAMLPKGDGDSAGCEWCDARRQALECPSAIEHRNNAAPQAPAVTGNARPAREGTEQPAVAAPYHTNDELRALRAFVEAFKTAYPNIRQLQDGFSQDESWSAWDQSVREETIRLGAVAFDQLPLYVNSSGKNG